MATIAFFDLETDPQTRKVLDIGAILSTGATFHQASPMAFAEFVGTADFLCGHNILAHDLPYLQQQLGNREYGIHIAIDTLLLSPLLFPQKPYHNLLKDDKLQTEERSNPLNDAQKAQTLFYDEVNTFRQLPPPFQAILYQLLGNQQGFSAFFKYIGFAITDTNAAAEWLDTFLKEHTCHNSPVQALAAQYPVAMAYTLTLLHANDRYSITPPWVLKNYPEVERLLFLLRNNPCVPGCGYCNQALNPIAALKRHFGFDAFRSYDGEPLQENAVKAAVQGKSILAVFPTGGGKSITFQVPALMSGENAKALTVVISPLQSLMKDQVDNLEKAGITEAVTINGLLDPIERSQAIERIENGMASLLYIAPESLRSVTIERLLLKRKIARFVIDEAHCFSSWGQDFRVDYLYIGDFIKQLQLKKNMEYPIPVSCFTATAKQKVIEDIRDYFKEKLGPTLEVFKAQSGRANLHYRVFQRDSDDDKYNQLRSIIESKECPTIVYVSRTKRAYQLAERLTSDGFSAKPYHGKMEREEKTTNQDAFMTGQVNIIVATSAFGMGVDKKDVGAVIHYDISDSLENYVQEAGRAGRDEKMEANCYVLFNETDLDKHFILLNQTKISSKEINQVWKAIKELTKTRSRVSNSALEIARKAGWDENINEIETRVTTAVAALEEANYLKRGQNMPRIFANSILSNTADEAIKKINDSPKFNDAQKLKAIRIIKKLFSSKSKRLSTDEAAESRIDYMSDQLGFAKEEVIRVVELLKEEKILAQTKDLTAFIKQGENSNRSWAITDNYRKIEDFLFTLADEQPTTWHLKEINEQATAQNIRDCSPNKLKTILNFWVIKNWIKRKHLEYSKNHIQTVLTLPKQAFREKLDKRHLLARLITEHLYKKVNSLAPDKNAEAETLIEFSVLELKEMAMQEQGMFALELTIDDIEDCLFYLSRIEAIKIEGGFLVVHNRLSINRLEQNNRIQYKESDYEKLRLFYQQKVQQIHIVGEYAKKMIRNYEEALQFTDDYFNLNYTSFLSKYFPGSRLDEIKRSLTPEKFLKLFGALSPAQLAIIKDTQQHIVVAAGPGSGKTRVLVHKLASLILAEDVKHEQLLMLTFAKAAATEFKKRLIDLIGNAAHYIEIKTFHGFCFDLLGKVGNLTESETVLKMAVEKIKTGDIEISRITKTVLVVDEAQDMSEDEYALIQILMQHNEDMRVILVGDDDQNIYTFRGSNSKYMQQLLVEKTAVKYELTENYRSASNIVQLANQWATTIQTRLKIEPGYAIRQTNGHIEITTYQTTNLLAPLAAAILTAPLSGSTCVLTHSNEDAAILTGLLVHNGMPAKLIQTNDGFRLNNLYELHYFSNLLNNNTDTPIVGEADWDAATRQLIQVAGQSNKLALAQYIIQQFAAINTQRKYKSDWNTFLAESAIEDFTQIDTETIYVSTIHKAKGKEFDNVFLLLKNFSVEKDEQKRQLYVAITRAKTNLSIHYNSHFLSHLQADNLTYHHNENSYEAPKEITIQLTLKDVYLGYFDYVQYRVNALHSGQPLSLQEDGLGNSKGEKVLKYAQKFKDRLLDLQRQGFVARAAVVNFMVYWKKQDAEQETLIVLPELVVRKG